MKKDVCETFLRNITDHELQVLHDDGVYRHLRCSKPDAVFYWFEITTWPEMLTIQGDMGCWTFSRVRDMFKFFRRDTFSFDVTYWAEKIQSRSKYGGPERIFSPEAFKASVLSRLDGHDLSDAVHTDEQKKAAIINQLRADVFSQETEHGMRDALADFECDGFQFYDTWEIDGTEWSFHFLWNLHAIVWAIQQYDAHKAAALAAPNEDAA